MTDEPTNTVETAEAAARRYAGQLLELERGLTQRNLRPNAAAPVDTWAVDLALNTIDKARTERARTEASAGAYLLAHDHLAAVTRTLVDRVTAAIGPTWPVPVHGGTREALDNVRDALSRDLESYLTDPDDITPDTRIDLTPAGAAVAAQERLFEGIPEQIQAIAQKRAPALRVASVPHVARESGDEDVDYSPAAGRLIGRLMDEDLAFLNRLGVPDVATIAFRQHWLQDLAPIIAAEVDQAHGDVE